MNKITDIADYRRPTKEDLKEEFIKEVQKEVLSKLDVEINQIEEKLSARSFFLYGIFRVGLLCLAFLTIIIPWIYGVTRLIEKIFAN